MAKKTIYPGTQGRKNEVLKRPIDLTGINKVPIKANVRWAKVRLAPYNISIVGVSPIYI